MGVPWILWALAFLGLIVVGSVLGIVAFARVRSFGRTLRSCLKAVESLVRRVDRLEQVLQKGVPAGVEPADVEEPRLEAEPPCAEEEELEAPVPVHAVAAPPQEPAAPPLPRRDRAWWEGFEKTVGERWMAWAGAAVLFLAAGFLVKYAVDHGWIGPTARVAFGITLGVVLLGLGDRSVRRRMRALGQALMGGGVAILYVSLFAAFSLYHLIPQEAAFAAMVLVTAGGMALAVLHDAVAVSVLAVLGGLLTPLLLSTGEDARDVLFGYLVVLDVGVLSVALFRRWRALDVLAFVGTAALFAGWFETFYRDPAMVPTLLWLAAFYFIFLLMPFAYHLSHKTPIAPERFLMALANAALVFGCAYRILGAEHTHVLGFVALAMGACYLALGSQTRKRIPADDRGLFGFVALVVVFLTMAVPLHLRVHGITLAWAIEGPVLLYLGYRYRYLPVRIGSFVVLVLALLRLFTVHWPLHGALFVPIWNPHFASAVSLPLASAAFGLIHHWQRKESVDADRKLKLTGAIGAGFLFLGILHAELGLWFHYSDRSYLGQCSVAVLWAAGSAAFLAAGIRMRSLPSRMAGLAALTIALALSARLYGGDVPHAHMLFLNARFGASLVVVLAVFVQGYVLRRRADICPEEQGIAKFLYAVGGCVLLALLSAEAYRYCREEVRGRERRRWTALMALSVVWGGYAAAALAIGFWRRVRPLRIAALVLFGATGVKLILIDIAGVKQIYRIISFFVLGLLMMGGAYLYHRVEKRIAEPSGEGQ